MDIIKTTDKRYEEYAELLLKRDEVKKDAGSFLTAYICEFGELITKVFEAKIECIKKKKSIAFCQSVLNRGEYPSAKGLQAYIEKNMQEYYEQLDGMIDENKKAQEAKIFTAATVRRCSKLYKQIAKLIHPDLNPEAGKNKVVQELWNRAVEAHKSNDLKTLEELLLLVEKAVSTEGLECLKIDIPDINDRIKDIRLEIENIVSTTPYTYGALLRDIVKMDEKKTGLQTELEEYRDYAKELEAVLEKLPMKGKTTCQMN
ncbi:MAG: hypothetical protein ACI4KL_02040 [Lentihominibacter sp.]